MKKTPPKAESLNTVLATDCGSTTTKAVLFEKTASGWRQTFRGEAPTTVEKPVQDVTIGARNAFKEVGELSGRNIIDQEISYSDCPLNVASDGIDLYVSTSSAGGGLQMIVGGLVGSMTTESAERAALGAGAIVMDALSADDGRENYEQVQKIRHLRPDIVLLAGGTDGGARIPVLELAETLLQADPRPRFGDTLKLPVVYAANKETREQARKILERRFEFVEVDNLRPTLEREHLAPARDSIHELFLGHVMSHAPGYDKLLTWTPCPIMPTPAAVGDMVQTAAREDNITIVAVDIGGATTDVFSVFKDQGEPVFNRTVSANLGMSYSVANVLLEAGEENISRWIPFPIDGDELRDRLRNKMIRPTSIPHTAEDLALEQAVCREALRLAFVHHRRLAQGLKGKKSERGIAGLFGKTQDTSLVDMKELDLIIGSGGVLSHAPDRRVTALMLTDAYEPVGITRLAVDSIFMMPHLGVFSSVHPQAASEIFNKDCVVPLGYVIAPTGQFKEGKILRIESPRFGRLEYGPGEIARLPLSEDEEEEFTITPLGKYDVGGGLGEAVTRTLSGGQAGILIDTRGRPINFATDRAQVFKDQARWHEGVKS